MNYQYIQNFHKSRESRIGASEIPALIPHPERPTETLATFTRDGKRIVKTALDLYEEKVNGRDYEYSFAADMGHFLEGKVLYEFIKDNISGDIAKKFMHNYQMYKMDKFLNKDINPVHYNKTPFKHHTEDFNEYGVAHADCVYDPDESNPMFIYKTETHDNAIVNKNGLTIDLSKPFIIEAKSANYFSAKRKDDIYKGYDLTLKEWQGIPLSHYMQIQYQLTLYNVDVCYLALIYNTNEKHYWQIKANKNHQKDLIQIAQHMKRCIDTKTPPRELAMNQSDIKKLYPVVKDDFTEITGDQLQSAIKSVKEFHEAKRQETIWKRKKIAAEESMSIHLKDIGSVKGIIKGEMCDIAKWKVAKSSKRVRGLGHLAKLDEKDAKRITRYLNKNDLIYDTEESKKASVVLKKDVLEGLE